MIPQEIIGDKAKVIAFYKKLKRKEMKQRKALELLQQRIKYVEQYKRGFE